ncbi:unnamed protein product [Closterium sp. NIES-53]
MHSHLAQGHDARVSVRWDSSSREQHLAPCRSTHQHSHSPLPCSLPALSLLSPCSLPALSLLSPCLVGTHTHTRTYPHPTCMHAYQYPEHLMQQRRYHQAAALCPKRHLVPLINPRTPFSLSLCTLAAIPPPAHPRQVGQQYLEHLMQQRRYHQTATLCPKLLRSHAASWERWVVCFAQAHQLPVLLPHIPFEHPQLAPAVYEVSRSGRLHLSLAAMPAHLCQVRNAVGLSSTHTCTRSLLSPIPHISTPPPPFPPDGALCVPAIPSGPPSLPRRHALVPF